MTTQTPYEPPSPYGAYSTAPPWAPEPAPPPVAPQPPRWIPHGQLMVPYPEEMANAGRPTPPSWVPVVIWTFFFGAFGAISASRRADAARRTRNDRHPYWIAFGATMGAGMVAWGLAVAFAVPTYLAMREEAVTKAVESGLTASGERVASTSCEPAGARAADGLRAYDCTVRLADGRTGQVRVTADSEGHWKFVE